jgi:hypothetical protein
MTDDGACRHLPLTLFAQNPYAADATTPQRLLRIVAIRRADLGSARDQSAWRRRNAGMSR